MERIAYLNCALILPGFLFDTDSVLFCMTDSKMEHAPIIHGSAKKFDIPIDHLDFTYIRECSNVRELEKICRVLRYGFFLNILVHLC